MTPLCCPEAAAPLLPSRGLLYMPPGTVEILFGLALAVALLLLLLEPVYRAGKDISGAVDVTAWRAPEGVRVRLARFPLTKGVVVHSVGIKRELADELGLDVPEGLRVAMDLRWLSAEGRVALEDEPVELLFPASREASRPVAASVRIVSSYRPGIRRMRHYTVRPVRAGEPRAG